MYNQEQIKNCTVKSFSEHKIEKSLWKEKKKKTTVGF